MGEIGRRKRGSKLRRAAVIGTAVLLALGLATAAVAQNNASATIVGTAHDFSAATSVYQVGTGENHCEVCHGPPVFNPGTATSEPEWRHASNPVGDYANADWTYAGGDGNGTWAAGELTVKCMGCHEGATTGKAVDEYIGGPTTPAVWIAASTDESFGKNLAVHHPVDILYDLVANTGLTASLEDPTAFVNPQGGGSIDATLLDGGYIRCDSCHEQHNDRRFDLLGGDPNDDPEMGYGNTDISLSELHNFVIFDRLCFKCHTHDQPHDGVQHHIPGREDPLGLARGDSPFNCTGCHGTALQGKYGHIPACDSCHNSWDPTVDTDGNGIFDQPPEGHHGGNRLLPYFDCAVCHADPLTGILTGNDFGSEWAPSCYQCHEEEWDVGGANPAPTMSDLTGVVNQTVTFDASGITDPEGDPIAFQWDFGDGSPAPFPSHDPVTTHTYTDYGTFVATLAVTDGTHPPDYVSFNVVIADAATEPVADTWTVTPSIVPSQPPYDITFENHSGSLVGWADVDGDPLTPDQLSFGVEFVGVVFWMEMWMDLSGDVFWGTGDMYFGNVTRGEPGSMTGILFKADGTMGTFTASGGAPPGGH